MAWAVGITRDVAHGAVLGVPEASAVSRAVARFLRRASELGIEARELELSLAGRVPAEANEPLRLRVGWSVPWELRLFGQRLLALSLPRRGTFLKYDLDGVIMPVRAERLATVLRNLPDVDEVTVLVEERTDPILAVRIGDRWLETHRWFQRPYIICDAERLPLPTTLSCR